MDKRDKPKATDEEKAFYAGVEMARASARRNDIVNMYREYKNKDKS